MELSDFSFIDIKLSNLSYLAESRNYNSTNNIPQISEFHTFLAFKNETYFLDESLIFNLEGRYYVENLYQYSLQGLYYINKNILIKILTKKGLRIPYLEEKYWQSSSVIGNSNLLPETIYKNLISLQFKYSKFNLETELYYSILKDNIIFSPISFGLVKAINTQEATAKGINIISDLKFKHIKINNITSYNKTIYKETKKDVPQTPKLLNKFNILLTYKDYSFNINYTYTSKYYNNIFNTDIIPQKHLISINLNYIFDKKGSNLGFKINNLTNELKYYDSMHIPLPGRTYFLYLNFYFL
jgi:outer membrane cobalamin receptor